MMLFGKYLLFTNKIFDFDDKLRAINGITATDVNAFISMMNIDEYSLSLVGKNAEKIKL